MPETLHQQIEAYQRARPSFQAENKHGWVLVAHEAVVDVFANFDQAALYAESHFPHDQVLIRHTEETASVVPFIVSPS
jgi:hypothetical protein